MVIFKRWISRHKEFLQKTLAFIIALAILGSCVLISFLLPPIKVKAVDGSLYDSYLDSLPGRITNGPLSPGDGVSIGLQLALQQAYETMVNTGDYRNAGTVVTFTGQYRHADAYHLAYSYSWSGYSGDGGGADLCASDEFSVRATFSPVNSFQFLSCSAANFNPKYGISFGGRSRGSNISINVVDSGGSTIFPTIFQSNNYYGYDNWCNTACAYSSNFIPTLGDNSSLDSYFVGQVSTVSPIAGWSDGTNPRFDISSIPGANDFTFTSDNFLDFILEIYNPWIEENYPDLVVYLFDPSEEPTEETDYCPGCHCYHEINVHVEPTINVYVDNNVELPSEWTQDYTTPSFPVETIPWPTQDASESPPVELPTIDSEDYSEEFGTAIEFWFYVAKTFITKMHLDLIVAFAFALSVAGFILWGLGGGKDD